MPKPKKPKAEQADLDTPWKLILDVYFEQFMAYCWPEKHAEVDWSKGYKMLDKELSKIAQNAPTGNRVVDKLVELYLKNGETNYIIFHLEIQGRPDRNFGERMFIYNYRLYDLHRRPVASVAVLIDPNKNWRPDGFKKEFWGTSVEMRFPIIKLIDYRNRREELEQSNNPFAQVILAQLAALEKQSPQDKLLSKLTLIKRLYQKGWKKNDISNLLQFIDWVMALPDTLELEFQEVVREIEEEARVSYVTSFERIGIQKGLKQGIEQGIQKGESRILIRQLKRKFKVLPKYYKEKINQASADDLLEWSDRILDSKVLEEVFEL